MKICITVGMKTHDSPPCELIRLKSVYQCFLTSPFAILQLTPLFGKLQSVPNRWKYSPAVSRGTSLFTSSSLFCIVRRLRKWISHDSSECNGEYVVCFGTVCELACLGMMNTGCMSCSEVWWANRDGNAIVLSTFWKRSKIQMNHSTK